MNINYKYQYPSTKNVSIECNRHGHAFETINFYIDIYSFILASFELIAINTMVYHMHICLKLPAAHWIRFSDLLVAMILAVRSSH